VVNRVALVTFDRTAQPYTVYTVRKLIVMVLIDYFLRNVTICGIPLLLGSGRYVVISNPINQSVSQFISQRH